MIYSPPVGKDASLQCSSGSKSARATVTSPAWSRRVICAPVGARISRDNGRGRGSGRCGVARCGLAVDGALVLSTVLSFNHTGFWFRCVPYRGGTPAIQDLVAGHIDLAFSDPTAALPLVRAGTIKAYGITTKVRLASAPDVPTLHESGLPGFDVSVWHGL